MRKRFEIITLSGVPGSGKSSAGKRLAEELHYRHFSSGDIMREFARSRGLSIEEINALAETADEFDRKLDTTLESLASERKLVIDARIAFHWIPHSFKVFLTLDPHVAAERTFNQIKKEGRTVQNAASVDEVYEKTRRRVESERKRYEEKYNVDPLDPAHYDLIVDTEKNNLNEVVSIIKSAYDNWRKDSAS